MLFACTNELGLLLFKSSRMQIAQIRSTHRSLCAIIVLAGLTACGAPAQDATQAISTSAPQAATSISNAPVPPSREVDLTPAPTAMPAAPATQSAGPVAPTGVSTTSGDWPTYQADAAGYSVAYPAGWTIQEQIDGDAIITTFAPADGAPGISVSVQIADAELAEPLDLPNSRRCRPVVVGGVSGRRYLDIVRLQMPAPPGGQGKSYIIASTGPGIDQALYQRFLDSFTLTQ
jgi:hypothetical protein